MVKTRKRPSFSFCAFDLETTNLNADFGVVLCGVTRTIPHRPKLFSQRQLNPTWENSALDDKGVVAGILDALAGADFWIAHNGRDFDLPFLHTRADHWGLAFPAERPLLDPVILARRHFRLCSNSLESLARHFDLPRKTPLKAADWQAASLARCELSMRRIEDHCKRDVEILCRLAPHFRGLWKHLGATGSFY